MGTPIVWALNKRWFEKKLRFSSEIAVYHGNGKETGFVDDL